MLIIHLKNVNVRGKSNIEKYNFMLYNMFKIYISYIFIYSTSIQCYITMTWLLLFVNNFYLLRLTTK